MKNTLTNTLSESLGVSDIVVNTAKQVTSQIIEATKTGNKCEDYYKGDGFIRTAFMIEKVGFIGKLWVTSVFYSNAEDIDDDFSAQVPAYENDELEIREGYLYTANKYLDYLSLNVEWNSENDLLPTITHELKHLYYSYISKTKNVKTDKFYEDGVRNYHNPIGNFLYLTNVDEIQAYTHDSYVQLTKGVDIKDTKLYDLYDYLKSFEISDYRVQTFIAITEDMPFNKAKHILQNRLRSALKMVRSSIAKILAKFNDNKITETRSNACSKCIHITESQFKRLLKEDVYVADKNTKTKTAKLKYTKNSSRNIGNLVSSDKIKTDKMDVLGKDTYEVPLKNGLMSYNITSIKGSEVMHYFKRRFSSKATFIKIGLEQFQLMMEDAEFEAFFSTI